MLLTTTGGRRACIIGKYTRALAEPLGFNLQSLNHFRGRRCWRWRSREGLHIRHIRNLKCEAFFSAHAKCASIAASLKAFAVFISGILEEVHHNANNSSQPYLSFHRALPLYEESTCTLACH